jgi:hypothetical protein
MDLHFVLTIFALTDTERGRAQQLYDDLTAGHPPPAPAELWLIIEAVMSGIEIERTQRSRAAIAADKLRRAELDDAFQRADEHLEHRKLLETSPYHAIVAMKRTPLGLRHTIEGWEHLERTLQEHGTWYSPDRILATQLCGLPAHVDELYRSEQAYGIWRDALAAQPSPNQSDIDLVRAPNTIPKSLHDRNVVVWPVDPAEARARLHALVQQKLAELRPAEQWLRENIEEPEKATLHERALARVTPEDQRLLQALRSHQRDYERATAALEKLRHRSATAASNRRAASTSAPASLGPAAVCELEPALFNPQDHDPPPAMASAIPTRPLYHHTTHPGNASSRTERSLPPDWADENGKVASLTLPAGSVALQDRFSGP